MGTGFFISFEGIDGSGKTTQSKLLAERLIRDGCAIRSTREPGGTGIGDRVRDILLDPANRAMTPEAELLLYNAARAQHMSEVILPFLASGGTVITDRFIDSTIAYQGFARGLRLSHIAILDLIATGERRPDLTLLLDLSEEEGLRRNRDARKADRFDTEEVIFHRKVREGFLLLARSEPERFAVIDAAGSPDAVHEHVYQTVKRRLWQSEPS